MHHDSDPLKIPNLIWAGILASCFMFAGIAIFIFAKEPLSSQLLPIGDNPIEKAMGGMAIVMFIASFLLPRFLVDKIPAQIAARSDPANNPRTVRGLYFVSRIIGFALAESCVLYGLVLTTALRSDRIIFPFLALSVISLLANRPRAEQLREIERKSGIHQ